MNISTQNKKVKTFPPKGLCNKKYCKFKCRKFFSTSEQYLINKQYYLMNRQQRNDFIFQNTRRELSDNWD
jgi:hypothetical protein